MTQEQIEFIDKKIDAVIRKYVSVGSLDYIEKCKFTYKKGVYKKTLSFTKIFKSKKSKIIYGWVKVKDFDSVITTKLNTGRKKITYTGKVILKEEQLKKLL